MSTTRTPDLANALATSRQYLDIIHRKTLTRAQGEELISLTLRNFTQHYNPGFLEYRKSMTEAGDFASVEWSGQGATFVDALGREYIDCLCGHGLLSLGWAHEKGIVAGTAQTDPSPMPPAELLAW